MFFFAKYLHQLTFSQKSFSIIIFHKKTSNFLRIKSRTKSKQNCAICYDRTFLTHLLMWRKMQQLMKRHTEEVRKQNDQFRASRTMPYMIIRHNLQWRTVCQNTRGAKLLLISTTGFCQTNGILFKLTLVADHTLSLSLVSVTNNLITFTNIVPYPPPKDID